MRPFFILIHRSDTLPCNPRKLGNKRRGQVQDRLTANAQRRKKAKVKILPVNNYNYQSKTQNNKQQNVNFGATPRHTKHADIVAAGMVADVERKGAELTGRAGMEARLEIVKGRILDIKKAVEDKRLTKEAAKPRIQELEIQEAQISRGLQASEK